MGVALLRKLNARNIELYATTRGEVLGVRLRSGEYRYLPWLGFISVEDARTLQKAGYGRGVRLLVSRYGNTGEININWQDVPEGRYLQGCMVAGGVYAVEPVRLV